MTLIDHIDDIRNKLKKNAYKDEAAVSIQIVNRLLAALNWPTYSPEIIIPEYSVENKRVDYALCHPERKPIIFIEVKQVGKIDGAEEQLFNYAFHEGVPILVLTDGRKWRFFHPAGTGNYQERLVIEIDLLTGKSDEVSSDLDRYLNYECAKSGDIIDAIREDYQNIADERLIQEGLPKAWNQLINQVDSSLVNIIAEKTREISGKLPTSKQVINFLNNLSSIPTPTIPNNTDPVTISQSNTPYQNAGKQLMGSIAKPLIQEFFADKGRTQKREIIKVISQVHKDRGGIDAESNIDQKFNNALQSLEKEGYAKNVEKGQGIWEIYREKREESSNTE